jgi:hypothetical protein
MNGRGAWIALIVSLLPVGAGAEVSATSPGPLVAGTPALAAIEVRGVPGSGALRADASVGVVERVEERGALAILHYRLPARPHPQRLCLLLWRAGDARVVAARLPILARTVIPVQTRRNSRVTVRVGAQSFGPLSSGARGRLSAQVLVPPGVAEAIVEVVDDAGLTSRKRIAIHSPEYNELALALIPDERAAGFRLEVATASSDGPAPQAQIGAELLPLPREEAGRWSARFTARGRSPEPLAIRVWLPGRAESARHAELRLAADAARGSVATVIKVRPATAPPPATPREGLRADLGVSVGMMHNLGALLAPRVGAELGLDYPLPYGRLGLRLVVGFARGGQRIPSGRPGLAEAEATVTMIPFGGGLVYRLSALRLSPFLFAGLLAQLVRSSTAAPDYLPERIRHDWALGVLGLAGIEPRLGPGRIVLQAGYQWCRIENPDLVLLGGGIVVEGGYRLAL